jgi:hypothetical protein
LAPATARLVILKVALPVLVRMTICPSSVVVPTVWLEKIKPVGARCTAGAADTPVPVKVMVCGLPAALSEMLRLPLRVPVAEGIKTTLTVQLFPAGTPVAQVFVWVKSPVAEILEMVSAALPVLVRVTGCAALVALRD